MKIDKTIDKQRDVPNNFLIWLANGEVWIEAIIMAPNSSTKNPTSNVDSIGLLIGLYEDCDLEFRLWWIGASDGPQT